MQYLRTRGIIHRDIKVRGWWKLVGTGSWGGSPPGAGVRDRWQSGGQSISSSHGGPDAGCTFPFALLVLPQPENILLPAARKLKVADFGLSINWREERPVTRAGTLDYMLPEVLVCPEKSRPEENKACGPAAMHDGAEAAAVAATAAAAVGYAWLLLAMWPGLGLTSCDWWGCQGGTKAVAAAIWRMSAHTGCCCCRRRCRYTHLPPQAGVRRWRRQPSTTPAPSSAPSFTVSGMAGGWVPGCSVGG